jgi:hypothetical protein
MLFKSEVYGFQKYDKTTFSRVYSNQNDEGYNEGLEIVNICPCNNTGNQQ